MSITDISYKSTKRRYWMPFFETYFGITIKFINPAVLFYLLMSNLADDFDVAYGDNHWIMHVIASIFVFIVASVIVISLFMCDYPEVFQHNVAQEFNADDRFELKLKFKNMLKGNSLFKIVKGKQNTVN